MTSAAIHSALFVIVAQAASLLSTDGIATALINFGGVGLLAATLFYLHTRALREHKEDMQAERKAWTEAVASERAAWADRYDRLEQWMERESSQTTEAFRGLQQAIDSLRWSREVTDHPEFRERTSQQNEALEEAKRRRPPRGG